MGATRNTGYLENLIAYDASNNVAIATTAIDNAFKITMGGSVKMTGALSGTSATFSGVLNVFVAGNNTRLANFSTSTYGSTRGLRINSYISSGGGEDCAIEFDSGVAGYGGFKFSNSGTPNLTIAQTGAATFSSSVTANSTGGISGTFKSNTFFGSIDLENTGGDVAGKWNVQAVSGGQVGGSAGSCFGIYSYAASAYRLWINGSGNVGIGTTDPEALLHLSKSSVAGEGAFIFIDNPAASTLGNKAGIRFATNAGATFSGYGSYIEAINTNAGNGAEDLTFGTWNGAARGERMRITSGGNLDFANGSIIWGYENQGIKLSKSGVGPKISLWASSQYLYLGYAETGGWERVYAQATSGGVYLTNGATSWTANSDERLKTINSGIQNAIDKILTLRAVNYSWKSDELNRKYLGLIAQDVQKVLPELVDKDEKDEIGTLGVRYTEMIPVLVKAIQELNQKIEVLENR